MDACISFEGNELASKGTPPLNIVLYEPEIAANTGAVGRTCVGLGAKLWLIEPLGFQIEDRKLKRAGLDYWTYLNWELVPNWELLKRRLAETNGGNLSKLRFFYFSKKAKKIYSSVSFQLGDVFVFGSESRGLPPTFIEDEEHSLRIPIRPQIRSLNLSVCVAIAGFEARRQLCFTDNV